MARGKHASAADARRAREDFERRALTAEREVERLRGQVTELQESSETRLAGLVEDLRKCRGERDAGAAPALAEALAVAEVQRQKMDYLKEELFKADEYKARLTARLIRYLAAEHGLPKEAASEMAHKILVGGEVAPPIVRTGQRRRETDPEKIRVLDAAQGAKHLDEAGPRVI